MKKNNTKMEPNTSSVIEIIAKIGRTDDWCSSIIDLSLPGIVYFTIAGIDKLEENETIKKIVWSFGDKCTIISTESKLYKPVKHIFKRELADIEVTATIHTSDKTIIPNKKFTIKTLKYLNGPPKQKAHYIDSAIFKKQIEQFYIDGDFTHELADSLQKIVTGLSFSPQFINYTYKDEMVGDAIVRLIKVLKGKKYDPQRGFAAFSYFSVIAARVFIARIKKEKKRTEALRIYQEEFYKRCEESRLIPSINRTYQNEEGSLV